MRKRNIILILYTLTAIPSFLYASQYVWAGVYFIAIVVIWFKLRKILI